MSVPNKSSSKVSLADLPDLMTIKEVAELLRISPLTIKRWGKKASSRQLELIPGETEDIGKRLF